MTLDLIKLIVYLKYAWVFTVIQGYTHHIAYPFFFNRYISDRERQSVLHLMIRAWFQLVGNLWIYSSWINYGNLLGWKFNGLNMPWILILMYNTNLN